MSLTLNIDPDVTRGDVVQNYKIIHEGQELMISIYKYKSNQYKIKFNGPLDFRIIRYKTNELPSSGSENGNVSK